MVHNMSHVHGKTNWIFIKIFIITVSLDKEVIIEFRMSSGSAVQMKTPDSLWHAFSVLCFFLWSKQ